MEWSDIAHGDVVWDDYERYTRHCDDGDGWYLTWNKANIFLSQNESNLN